MEKTYLAQLEVLKEAAAALPRTRFMAVARIDALVRMNMRWEKMHLTQSLPEHPWILTEHLVADAIKDLAVAAEIAHCDGQLPLENDPRDQTMEEEHHDLFQALWTQFDKEQYDARIARYDARLAHNNLENGYFEGMHVVDMGCGHGNFAHALLRAGAKSVLGVDYGEDSIRYANDARDALGISAERLRFKNETVYAVSEPSASFDFALQNGVFHHLEDEDRAYREMNRLLKMGGSAWIYSEGSGSVARDLFHVSVQILADVPAALVRAHLAHLGLSIGKRYHLGDGLKAVYRATSWAELTGRLSRLGFGAFKRLAGKFDTDLDVIPGDPHSAAKFGEGDLRILATKIGEPT